MAKGWSYTPGDWWVVCDSCGKTIKASESFHRWDGFIVCSKDYETRHPQDFLRTNPDKITVPFSRPEPADTFVEVAFINDYVIGGYVDDDYFERTEI